MIKAQFYINYDLFVINDELLENQYNQSEIGIKLSEYFYENHVDLVAMPKKGDLINIDSFLDKPKFSKNELNFMNDYDLYLKVSNFTFHNGFVEIDLE